MRIKIHESYRNVVALCDTEILGKKFEEGKMQLDVRESFFNGDEIGEEEAKKMLEQQAKNDATFNIVGEKSTKLALSLGIISSENIIKIQGIPLALVLL
ncbi:DUF424 family protein [Candidatus Pacearchaeota archaeon]|nr:DUF424 family protein [Candidatus Pacearchaeota archaeon]